jgi:hypothetical protein
MIEGRAQLLRNTITKHENILRQFRQELNRRQTNNKSGNGSHHGLKKDRDFNSNDDSTRTIKIGDLAKAISVVLNVCKNRGLNKIEISHLTYRQVMPDGAFNININDPELGLGDVFDDADIVLKIDKISDSLIGLHLSQIASLLNYIGVRHPLLDPSSADLETKGDASE